MSQIHQSPRGYRLSPYTYLIEGLLGQAIGGQQINCSAIEFVDITPPSGQTCGQYMDPYISFAGGYSTNPDATPARNFCGVRTTDDLMAVNYFSHRWRNLGLILAFTLFNISCIFMLTYLFRIRTCSLLTCFRRPKKA